MICSHNNDNQQTTVSLRWESKTAPWEFQTKLLHYFFMSNNKSNLHTLSFSLSSFSLQFFPFLCTLSLLISLVLSLPLPLFLALSLKRKHSYIHALFFWLEGVMRDRSQCVGVRYCWYLFNKRIFFGNIIFKHKYVQSHWLRGVPFLSNDMSK